MPAPHAAAWTGAVVVALLAWTCARGALMAMGGTSYAADVTSLARALPDAEQRLAAY
jgi:hypothetical protein